MSVSVSEQVMFISLCSPWEELGSSTELLLQHMSEGGQMNHTLEVPICPLPGRSSTGFLFLFAEYV